MAIFCWFISRAYPGSLVACFSEGCEKLETQLGFVCNAEEIKVFYSALARSMKFPCECNSHPYTFVLITHQSWTKSTIYFNRAGLYLKKFCIGIYSSHPYTFVLETLKIHYRKTSKILHIFYTLKVYYKIQTIFIQMCNVNGIVH